MPVMLRANTHIILDRSGKSAGEPRHTFDKRILLDFMSPWMTPLLCRKARPFAASSAIGFPLFHHVSRSPAAEDRASRRSLPCQMLKESDLLNKLCHFNSSQENSFHHSARNDSANVQKLRQF